MHIEYVIIDYYEASQSQYLLELVKEMLYK